MSSNWLLLSQDFRNISTMSMSSDEDYEDYEDDILDRLHRNYKVISYAIGKLQDITLKLQKDIQEKPDCLSFPWQSASLYFDTVNQLRNLVEANGDAIIRHRSRKGEGKLYRLLEKEYDELHQHISMMLSTLRDCAETTGVTRNPLMVVPRVSRESALMLIYSVEDLRRDFQCNQNDLHEIQKKRQNVERREKLELEGSKQFEEQRKQKEKEWKEHKEARKQHIESLKKKKEMKYIVLNYDYDSHFAMNNVEFVNIQRLIFTDLQLLSCSSYHREMFIFAKNSAFSFPQELLFICQNWKKIRSDGEIHAIGWNSGTVEKVSEELIFLLTSYNIIGSEAHFSSTIEDSSRFSKTMVHYCCIYLSQPQQFISALKENNIGKLKIYMDEYIDRQLKQTIGLMAFHRQLSFMKILDETSEIVAFKQCSVVYQPLGEDSIEDVKAVNYGNNEENEYILLHDLDDHLLKGLNMNAVNFLSNHKKLTFPPFQKWMFVIVSINHINPNDIFLKRYYKQLLDACQTWKAEQSNREIHVICRKTKRSSNLEPPVELCKLFTSMQTIEFIPSEPSDVQAVISRLWPKYSSLYLFKKST